MMNRNPNISNTHSAAALFFGLLSASSSLLLCGCVPITNAEFVSSAGRVTFFDLTNMMGGTGSGSGGNSGSSAAGIAYSHTAQIVYSNQGRDSLQLPPYHRLVINLILPPQGYTDLCQFPAEEDLQSLLLLLMDNDDTTEVEFDFSPIALLVPLNRRRQYEQQQQQQQQSSDDGIVTNSTNTNTTVNINNIHNNTDEETDNDCDLLTKITVALQYQQRVIRDRNLWAVIFYNTFGDDEDDGDDYEDGTVSSQVGDTDRNSRIYPMDIPAELNGDYDSTTAPTTELLLLDGLDSLILATISNAAGTRIQEEMQRAADAQYKEKTQQILVVEENNNKNNSTSAATGDFAPYHLLSRGNLDWQYPVSLERRGNVPFPGGTDQMDVASSSSTTNDSTPDWSTITFIWFRFLLFACIFCFPCMRCARLWWAAGGRIRFRRNDRGWITGLVYQPAMDNWYNVMTPTRNINDAGNGRRSSKRKKLKEEQVLALPEIVYRRKLDDSESGEEYHPNHDSNGNTTTFLEQDRLDNLDDAVEGPIDVDTTAKPTQEDEQPSSPEVVEEPNDLTESGERPGHKSHMEVSKTKPCSSHTTILNTMCSICIEEFEDGETVRLLPRCGHGFHTECILPWLTERQGCCPFCKTCVLAEHDKDGEEERGDEGVIEDNDNQAATDSAQNTDVESQQPTEAEESRSGS